MGKYQAYPEYKDSGVEWFGLVPNEWQVSRLKFESYINMGQSPNSEDCNQDGVGLPFLQGNAEFGIRSPLPKQYCEIPRKVAQKGDLLFSVRAPVGALNLANQKYGIGRGLCAISNNESLTPDFLWWLIPVVKSELDAVSTGSTFEAVSAEQVENVVIFKPLLDEQQKIANFLDHETAKIDTLIEKQQQLIALLKEKRQAVISHAVTKGLNANAPMRDSGVEWLGEVPEKWCVVPLKYLVIDKAGIQMGPFGGMLKDLEYSDTGYKLYGQENTISGDFTKGGRFLTKQRYEELSNYKLEDEDIVLTRKGSLGKARQINNLETPGIIDSDTIRVRVNLLLTSDFLSLLMHEAHYIAEQITRTRRGSVLPGLNSETISNLKIILPLKKAQQDELVVEVRRIIKFYEHGLDRCLEKCELLGERRTALISAAVTGKIDVRSWQDPGLSGSQNKEGAV